MIKTESEIEVYEVDDVEVSVGKEKKVYIASHWNRRDFIVLKYKGKKLTVLASDLICAVNNATNRGS